jgi:hypothetical protein
MKQKKSTLQDPAPTDAAAEYDFDDVYANCAHLEISAWDAKVIFGQLDQSSGTPLVDWHTAVTLPWPQAKILAYYLQATIEAYEAINGRIKIPAGALPMKPVAPTNNSNSRKQQNPSLASKLYEQLERDVARP